jgi:hypothetical protein
MTRNDRTIRVLLAAVALLLGANLLIQFNAASAPRPAMAAGIPDSGAQMQAVVDQLADLNKKVDKLDSFLESGKLQVTVKDAKADK